MRFITLFFLAFLFLGCNDTFYTIRSLVSFCVYPETLKNGLEEALKKSCQDINKEDLDQIESLNLSLNEDLEDIRSGYLRDLSNLKSIEFKGNYQLIEIPSFVYLIENLEELNISETSITDFSSEICQLKNLKTLIGKNNLYKKQ